MIEFLAESFDFLSIAFALGCIFLPLRYGLILALLCAFYKETSSMYPAGLFMCCYISFAIFFDAIRNSVSWRSFLPWFLTINIFLLYIAVIKSILLASYRVEGISAMLTALSLQTLLGCMFATFMTLTIFHYYKKIDARW